MEDVRVFVREDQPQPVACVADDRIGARAGGRDLDQVVGHRRRPAVREIRLVDKNDVDAHAGASEPRFHLGGNLLGNGGEPLRDRFFPLVKMDVESRR